MNDPIFVVGIPRSGSTLWENIIAKNPKILRLAEMLYLTPWRKDFRYYLKKYGGNLDHEDNIRKILELIFSGKMVKGNTGSFWRFKDIGIVKESKFREIVLKRIMNSDKSVGSFFKIIIEQLTEHSGYRRCCVAFPVYINHVNKLIEWYPECKIIHVTRDPRAIAMSKTNDPTGTRLIIEKHPKYKFIIRKLAISFVIYQYIWSSKIYLKYKETSNFRLFRYEDLLVEPEKVIKDLCNFARIDFTPQMLYPFEGMSSSISRIKYNGIDRTPASHWKKIITKFEERIITTLTRKSIKRYEFDLKNHPIYNLEN